MQDENSTASRAEGQPEGIRMLFDGISTVATQLNGLLLIHAQRAFKANDNELAAHCMSLITHAVRVFNGDEAATNLMNSFTDGLYEEMKDMMDGGFSAEEAAQKIKEKSDDNNKN